MDPYDLEEMLKLNINPEKNDWTAAECDFLKFILKFAEHKIINRRYPFDDTVTTVPNRYKYTQVEIATEIYNKAGAEGQTTHDENGIRRVWGYCEAGRALLLTIPPVVGVG